MNQLEQRSKELFNNSFDPELGEKNAQKWVDAVNTLGDKWVLRTFVQKKELK